MTEYYTLHWVRVNNPVVRANGPLVYEVKTVALDDVRPGDYFCDDVDLGAVLFIQREDVMDGKVKGYGFRVATSGGGSYLWNPEQTRVLRPVAPS